MISTKSFLSPRQQSPQSTARLLDALVIGHLSKLVHLSARRAPWVVTCRVPNFGLHIRITLGIVLDHAEISSTVSVSDAASRAPVGSHTEAWTCPFAGSTSRSDNDCGRGEGKSDPSPDPVRAAAPSLLFGPLASSNAAEVHSIAQYAQIKFQNP